MSIKKILNEKIFQKKKHITRLFLLSIFLVIIIGEGCMNKPLYQWKVIRRFDNEIASIEFISPLKGWMSDFIFDNDADSKKSLAKYRWSTNRIQSTEDGGKTWKIIYQSSGLIERLRYMNTLGGLLGIKVWYDDKMKQRPLHFMLYKSIDKGYNWEKICDLPYATENFYFVNENNGYAWTLGKIFATSNQGKQWNLIATMNIIYRRGKLYNVGKDNFIYFIKNNDAIGMNPWQNRKVTLALPNDFKPKDILANPSQSTVYVLGVATQGWTLLVYKNNELISTELVPLEQASNPESFAYGENILNLVGSTSSFFKPYHFYVKNQNGWHTESLSGSKNFEHFAYWGNHAWAIRIALLRGNRELLQRIVKPAN
jgi:hypothetical protein